MEEPPETTMVEEREELMVSPTGGNPTLRKAHFLKPPVDGTATHLLSPSPSSLPPTFDPQNWPLVLSFNGWWFPGRILLKWVDFLRPRYQSVWKQAGIYDAILSTTHQIRRDDDLVCGIAERWCAKTKTFLFVWGEATITLEDVMVLGGFSVLGQPVSLPLETMELKEIEDRLVAARKEVLRSKAHNASVHYWARKFMGSGSDIEHEAFLVLWLSKFIFPNRRLQVRSSIFSIAVRLARGTRIALAPPVLAAIYKDLTLLKQTIVASVKFDTGKYGDDVLALNLWSPFQLVQLWVWERFPELQPRPNALKDSYTRSARWHKVKGLEVENVRSVMDSAGKNFLWRPYTIAVDNWQFHKFYKEQEEWFSVCPGLDEELLSFTQCTRVSLLVGLGNVEQYLPHRVAMQFGMDQDLPISIPRTNETPEAAWNNYYTPINTKSYVPPRLFESDVTIRYLEWWKQYVSGQLDAPEGVLLQPSSSKRLKRERQDSEGKGRAMNNTNILTDRPEVLETPRSCNGHDSVSDKAIGDDKHSSGKYYSLKTPDADNEDKRMVARPVENVMQSNEAMVGSRATVQGINETKVMGEAQNNAGANGNAGEDGPYKHQTSGSELEARVTKLEEIFAMLKAAKRGYGLDRIPKEES